MFLTCVVLFVILLAQGLKIDRESRTKKENQNKSFPTPGIEPLDHVGLQRLDKPSSYHFIALYLIYLQMRHGRVLFLVW